MELTLLQKNAERFRALHHNPGILVIANAWDVVSALLLEDAGFTAIATTSAGIGYSYGYPIGEAMPLPEMLKAVARISGRLSIPLSADMEAGYGETPEQVAETTRLTLEAGAVGINIEDRTYQLEHPLIEITLAAERIQAAREAADGTGVAMVINARTDGYQLGGQGAAVFDDTVRRANAYREAGADCLFVPGISDADIIARLVQEIDGPINILPVSGCPDVPALAALGVRRVTIGATFARLAYAAMVRAADELKNAGSYTYSADIATHAEMNNLMAR